MKNKWIILFASIAAIHLFANIVHNELLSNTTKPILLLVLLLYYLFNSSQRSNLIITALGFSWLGDVLLIFQTANSLFFILGLLSFLTAHLFYVAYFKKLGFAKWKPAVLLLVAVYSISFYSLLFPKLGGMATPVAVYALVISAMLVAAIHAKATSIQQKYFTSGAILFAISDSVLAVNKFYQTLPQAGFIIMLTYIVAQYLLVSGAACKQNSLIKRINFVP